MDFLRENKNIVIVIALLVIGYLLYQSETFQGLLVNLRVQWNTLSTTMKAVLGLVVVGIAYYLWNKQC